MSLSKWTEQFLFDRKVRGFTPGTVTYHAKSLARFTSYCQSISVDEMGDVTPSILRGFIASMERLAPNTVRNSYKSFIAFLHWFEEEEAIAGWHSPASKVSCPKAPNAPIQPIPIQDVLKVIRKCPNDLMGIRDRAVLLVLLDTGIRAAELVALDQDDVDLQSGQMLIRHGKGNKTRAVFCGKDTRRALRLWLASRTDTSSALFVSLDDRARLTYSGLCWIVIRRFKNANVKQLGIHTFRRLFALTMLRNGTDVITLSRLMGHSTTEVLRRYLAQTDDDLRVAHAKASPVDKIGTSKI